MTAVRPNNMVRECIFCAINRLLRMVLASLLSLGFLLGAPSSLASEQKPQSVYEKWSSAIANDRVETLKQLLDQHLNKNKNALELLNKVAPNGKSALMVACKHGEIELVNRLVNLGANVNEVTHTGGTPLMFAVLGNHVSLARWLHKAGADINAKGSNGWSAATIAGAKGQTDMLRWLIESDADINSPDVYRFTPLMRAVDNKHVESVQILLAQGQAGVNFKDESDNTALHFAVANKQRNVIKLLLQFGANPLQANRDDITPLDLAKNDPALSQIFAQ